MIDVGRVRSFCQYNLYAIYLCEVCNFTRQTDAMILVQFKKSENLSTNTTEGITNDTR